MKNLVKAIARAMITINTIILGKDTVSEIFHGLPIKIFKKVWRQEIPSEQSEINFIKRGDL